MIARQGFQARYGLAAGSPNSAAKLKNQLQNANQAKSIR
jgi:hypothetical protein